MFIALQPQRQRAARVQRHLDVGRRHAGGLCLVDEHGVDFRDLCLNECIQLFVQTMFRRRLLIEIILPKRIAY